MKIEYLILFPNDPSFCSTKKAFIGLLEVDSKISISNKTITYRTSSRGKELIKCTISIQTGLIATQKERYYLVILETNSEDKIDELFKLSENIKQIALKLDKEKTIVNTIWDDVGRHYAELSYPRINEIENLMRKLISKFMLISAGIKWSKDAIHPDIYKKIEGYSDEEVYSNDLYKLDFILLSDVLFKKKRYITINQLDRKLQRTDFNESDQEYILKFIPKSNWEKYFSDLLNEDGDNFQKKWKRIYKIRNKVAHNRSIKKDEYKQLLSICNEVEKPLIDAINKLEEIDLDDEERESIISSYEADTPEKIQLRAERSVIDYYDSIGYKINKNGATSPIDLLVSDETGVFCVMVFTSLVSNLNIYIERLASGFNESSKKGTLFANLTMQGCKGVKIICLILDLNETQLPKIALEKITVIKEQIHNSEENVELLFGALDELHGFTMLEV